MIRLMSILYEAYTLINHGCKEWEFYLLFDNLLLFNWNVRLYVSLKFFFWFIIFSATVEVRGLNNFVKFSYTIENPEYDLLDLLVCQLRYKRHKYIIINVYLKVSYYSIYSGLFMNTLFVCPAMILSSSHIFGCCHSCLKGVWT